MEVMPEPGVEVLRGTLDLLVPALHRLETRGWIDAEWGTSENNRRAKFYTITAKGRAQLRLEAANWIEHRRRRRRRRASPSTGRRNDSVHAQILDHLSIVVAGVDHRLDDQRRPRCGLALQRRNRR